MRGKHAFCDTAFTVRRRDMLRIASQNDFKRIIAYNSDYAPTQRVYEV